MKNFSSVISWLNIKHNVGVNCTNPVSTIHISSSASVQLSTASQFVLTTFHTKYDYHLHSLHMKNGCAVLPLFSEMYSMQQMVVSQEELHEIIYLFHLLYFKPFNSWFFGLIFFFRKSILIFHTIYKKPQINF